MSSNKPYTGEVKDRCGKTIVTGSKIAYAVRTGNSASLRVGDVVAIEEGTKFWRGRIMTIPVVVAMFESNTKTVGVSNLLNMAVLE